jgi:mRNA-degrading endonuclease toxin of MazEF toxin-antitoxin module
MINFFHQKFIFDDFKAGHDVLINKKMLTTEKEIESNIYNNHYIKARPAIILSAIWPSTNNKEGKSKPKPLGYIVAPLTSKEKKHMAKYRTKLVTKALKEDSYIKWDSITTVSSGEIICPYYKNKKRSSFSEAEKKYISRQFKQHLNLMFNYLDK